MLPRSRIDFLFGVLSYFALSLAYDPYIHLDGSPLLVVEQVIFNATCSQSPSSAGCWEIELIFSSDGANSVLYLPGHPDWTANAGAFTDTFAASNFPCSVDDYNPAVPSAKQTACCIQDFLDKYRPATTFTTWAKSLSAGSLDYAGDGLCNQANGSTLLNSANAVDVIGDYEGIAEALPLSTKVGDPDGSSRALVILPDDKLQNITVEGTRGKVFFVGLASFSPAGTRFLNSAVQQIEIEVEKTPFSTVTTAASADHTFINWVNARVHRVTDQSSSGHAYYATVAFAVDNSVSLIPDPSASLVPDSSILVEKTEHACNASQLAAIGATNFYSILSQDICGPWQGDAIGAAAAMCAGDQQVAFNQDDGVGIINIPLGTTAPADPLDIKLVVAVQSGGAPSYATLDLALTTSDNRFSTWCESNLGTSDYAKDYVTPSLIVGSTATPSELVNLQTVSPLNATKAPPMDSVEASAAASTLQSGLLTFILDGTALPDDALTVHIEDMFTLHINGDATANSVASHLSDPMVPFNVSYDYAAKTASLELSHNLTALCPPTTTSYLEACASRREINDKVSSATTYELNSGDPAAFMQTLFGSESDFAGNLGTQYETVIDSAYGLDSKRTKAWWISPGFNWTGAGTTGTGVFSLSSKVVIVALFKIEDGATGSWRRRLLVSSQTPGSRETTAASVKYDVTARTLTASVLGVSPDLVTSWKIGLTLDPANACLPDDDLRRIARETLLDILKKASSGVRDVQISSVTVDMGGMDCAALAGNERRSLLTLPTMHVEALVVSEETSSDVIYIDANAIMTDERVTVVEQTEASSAVKLGSSAPEEKTLASLDESDSDTGLDTVAGDQTLILLLVSVGSVVCTLCCTALVYQTFRQCRARARQEELIEQYNAPTKLWIEADLVRPKTASELESARSRSSISKTSSGPFIVDSRSKANSLVSTAPTAPARTSVDQLEVNEDHSSPHPLPV